MELSCSRCHQTVQNGNCFCPNCGLPQLVYTAENTGGDADLERFDEAVRDANSVDWHSALQSTFPLAVPAGILCSMLSPVSVFGLIVMGATAAWVVALYLRSHRPSWITVGAGARIGFVTGVVGSWTAAAMSGISLYALRFWLHQGSAFDDFWQNVVNMQQQQGIAVGADAENLAAAKALMMSPEGRAGLILFTIAALMGTLVLFAMAGGAIGARMLNRTRRSEN